MMKRRSFVLLVLCAALVGGPAAVAGAQNDESDPPPKCFESGPNYELPTCTKEEGGEWTVSYPDSGFGGVEDGGIPDAFVAFMLLALIGGAAVTFWKVSMVRQMATEAGMGPGQATAVTLLSDDGLDATYIATSMRGKPTAERSSAPRSRSTAERLRELEQLRDDGLVTADEYDARRRAIVESV